MDNKKSLKWLSRIREFVFGMQDGVISTVGFLTGIQTAMQNQKVVMIAGFAQIFTGALSMGIGSYLSTKAEKEVFEGIRENEQMLKEEPYLAYEELLKAFEAEGVKREDGYRIVSILTRNAAAFRKTFYEKVWGIGSADISRPLQAALVMYLSFFIGGLFPISPYLWLNGRIALLTSVVLSCLALFGTGFCKGVLVKKSPVRSGFEFFLIALLSAVAGYLVGYLLGIPL